jgi:glycosyltransferase involved in cell wall biosynthesis
MDFKFEEVALLITVYNRSASLKRLLETFDQLGVSFGEVVVSDDGSKAIHLDEMRALQQRFKFKLVTVEKNQGLGHNINKGQDAVSKMLTAYIQEDFVPSEHFGQCFSEALEIMKAEQDIDVIRFYGYFRYPYTKPYNSLFSELVFKPQLWYSNHLKFYLYSDHPHLRRSNFLSKFGRYPEGISGDLTELNMSLSFIKAHGRALVMNDLTFMIDQKNSPNEPTTMEREDWKTKKSLPIRLLRAMYLKYRFLKNSLQLWKLKAK